MDATGHVTLIYQGTKVRRERTNDARSPLSFQYDLRVLPEQAAKYMSIMPEKKQIDLASVLISPMPGIVKSVSVKVGQRVIDGQEVCVVEAMKMQNKLTAGRAGVVSRAISRHSWSCDVRSSAFLRSRRWRSKKERLWKTARFWLNSNRRSDSIVTMRMNSYRIKWFFYPVVCCTTILVEYVVHECIFDFSFANMHRKQTEIFDDQGSCGFHPHWGTDKCSVADKRSLKPVFSWSAHTCHADGSTLQQKTSCQVLIIDLLFAGLWSFRK